MSASLPARGTLHLDGWGGRTSQSCVVVSETPKRYRVMAVDQEGLKVRTRGRGLLTVYRPGTYLVPKHAVTFEGGAK